MNGLTRRELMKAGVCAAALGAGLLARGAQAARRPNVVFILSDDQNNDTLGCFGGKVLTPHIDRLAKEGVKFTRAYAMSSVCTPSRFECQTGQFASRSKGRFLQICPPGTQANVGFNVEINPQTYNIGQVLKKAGYATGFVGKWHTGGPPPAPYPQDGKFEDPKVAEALAETQRRTVEYIKSCGFDYAASVYRGNIKDHKLDALTDHNQEWVTKGALDFIDSAKGRPFFLHMCTTLQHGPNPLITLQKGDWRQTPAGLLKEKLTVQPPRETIFERVKAAGLDEKLAHATWLDDGVGAVMKKVEELGEMDNTLFIFFSDNATRGGKGTCYDGGAHTPCLMMWRGRLPAGTECARLVQNVDFAPTILEACGVAAPPEWKLDGASVLAVANGKGEGWRETMLLEVGHTRAVVNGTWKYIAVRPPKGGAGIRPAPGNAKAGKAGKNKGKKAGAKAGAQGGGITLGPGGKRYHMDSPLDLQKTAEAAHPSYWDADQLFNLESDPQEKKNLAADPQYAQKLAEMKELLTKELARLDRPFGEFKK